MPRRADPIDDGLARFLVRQQVSPFRVDRRYYFPDFGTYDQGTTVSADTQVYSQLPCYDHTEDGFFFLRSGFCIYILALIRFFSCWSGSRSRNSNSNVANISSDEKRKHAILPSYAEGETYLTSKQTAMIFARPKNCERMAVKDAVVECDWISVRMDNTKVTSIAFV